MELKVTQVDGVKFAIQARNHTVISDQPTDNGGEDSRHDTARVAAGLTGIVRGFYAVQYLKTRNLAESGVEVTVTAEKLKQPGRLGNFRIQVACPVPLNEEQTEALMRSVHHCTIHNTMLSTPQIDIELAVPEPVDN